MPVTTVGGCGALGSVFGVATNVLADQALASTPVNALTCTT